MALGPIELNMMVGRAQDVSAIKQNEDLRPMTEQTAFQNQMERQKKSRQVRSDVRKKQIQDRDVRMRVKKGKMNISETADAEERKMKSRRREESSGEKAMVLILTVLFDTGI